MSQIWTKNRYSHCIFVYYIALFKRSRLQEYKNTSENICYFWGVVLNRQLSVERNREVGNTCVRWSQVGFEPRKLQLFGMIQLSGYDASGMQKCFWWKKWAEELKIFSVHVGGKIISLIKFVIQFCWIKVRLVCESVVITSAKDWLLLSAIL